MALEVGTQVLLVFVFLGPVNCAVVCLPALGKLTDSHKWVSRGQQQHGCVAKAVGSLLKVLKDSFSLENRLPFQLCLQFHTFASCVGDVIYLPASVTPFAGTESPFAYSVDFFRVFPGSGHGLFALLHEGFCLRLHLLGRCPGTTHRQLWTLSRATAVRRAFPSTDCSDLCSIPNADGMEGLP